MSWLSQALHGIGHVLGQVVKPIASGIGGIVSTVAGLVSGGPIGGIVSSIGSLLNDTGISGIASDIGSGLSELFGSGFSGFLSDVGSLSSSIGKDITDISNEIGKFTKPIETVVDDVSKLTTSINNGLVKPIANTIGVFTSEYTTLVSELHTDLRGGIQGILSIPGDIEAAIKGDQGQLQTALGQLTAAGQATATDVYVPALQNYVGGPITGISEVMKAPSPALHAAAAYDPRDSLATSGLPQDILNDINSFYQVVQNADGWWGPIVKFLWNIIQFGDLAISSLHVYQEIAHQNALASIHPTRLGAGDTVNAWRRGLLSNIDAVDELEHLGFDPTRAQLLYDLEQYLFGPRDAINLFNRSIIDKSTLDELMAQNNLDAGQVEALQALMQHVLGPTDIIAALARGLISKSVQTSMLEAANIPLDLLPIMTGLELDLVSPAELVRLSGRQAAADNGFLAADLKSHAPDNVQAQSKAVQQEEGTADLSWLAHWEIPGVEWWIRAYWRGLIDDKTLRGAFEAHNVPREVQVNLVAVAEELPPVWLVPDVVKSGVWSASEAIPTLMKLGFSEANAKVLYDYGASSGKTSKTVTAAELSKLSLSNAATMFESGLIDANTYQQVLIDHKYSLEAASLTVELAEMKDTLTARKDQADALTSQVLTGEINETEAVSQLYTDGYTTGEISVWRAELSKQIASRSKLPSEAQLEKLVKGGFITSQQWLEAMQLHGYSLNWAQTLAKLL